MKRLRLPPQPKQGEYRRRTDVPIGKPIRGKRRDRSATPSRLRLATNLERCPARRCSTALPKTHTCPVSFSLPQRDGAFSIDAELGACPFSRKSRNRGEWNSYLHLYGWLRWKHRLRMTPFCELDSHRCSQKRLNGQAPRGGTANTAQQDLHRGHRHSSTRDLHRQPSNSSQRRRIICDTCCIFTDKERRRQRFQG